MSLRQAPHRVIAALLLLGLAGAPAFALVPETLPDETGLSVAPAPEERVEIKLGELHTVAVNEPTRVAIGNPTVADVSVVNGQELLVIAKKVGETSLMVWDAGGQRRVIITVVDPEPQKLSASLVALLAEPEFARTSVRVDGDKIFLTGTVPTPEAHERLEKLIESFPNAINLVQTPGKAPPAAEKLIELQVHIMEMEKNFTDKLGVDWVNSLSGTETPFDAVSNTDNSLSERLVDMFRVGSFSRSGLTFVLNAVLTHGKGRLLAAPNLVTSSGKPATSFAGVEIPVVSSTSVSAGVVTQSVEFKNVGVTLDITPTIVQRPDGERIITALKAKISSVDSGTSIVVSGTTVPGFKTREVNTEIETRPEEAIVISGLLQNEEASSVAKVPALGNMPVLGYLFKSRDVRHTQTELVITVTPRLVRDQGEAADQDRALEQALTSAEVAGAVEDPQLRYALQVQGRIAKAIRYPQREKELSMGGTVKVKLHLFADGSLSRAVVSSSSGIESLDMEALKAAESQAPYPPFPQEFPGRELWLEVPVIFRP